MKTKKLFCFCGAEMRHGECPFCVTSKQLVEDEELKDIMQIMSEKAASRIGQFVANHK